MAEEFDFHPMWESLGMNLADHDMLLGAVGQMYGDMFLTQNNRPKSTSYLDFVATNIHSGRIKEMLDKKEAGEATKIVGSFCVYVPEEIVLACDGIPVGLCSGADWATDKVEEHLPRNTCPLIKSFAGFKLGEVCPYIESSDLVVGEESCTGSRYYKDLVDESGETVDEMLDAIAERYFKINCAVFTPNDQRMKDIVQMAKDLHADGIVDVALQFCTLYEMESFAVEKAAEEAGIPFMHITTDYAGEDAGQLQTRIEAFLETI